jgi:hypothetical protein
VTLCIAAETIFGGEPIIAMCSDRRRQTGLPDDSSSFIGSDDSYKLLDWFGVTAMLSGVPTMAKELAAMCRKPAQDFWKHSSDPANFDLAVNELLEQLRSAGRSRKRQILTHFVEMKLGISLEEFHRLPQENYLDTWAEIRSLTLGSDILLCAVGGEPIIVRLDRNGNVHWESNYSAIGDGAEVARALLCLQPWYGALHHTQRGTYVKTQVPLAECLYRLDEAKRAAHLANPSSISAATSFEILTRDSRSAITPEFNNLISTVFEQKHRVPVPFGQFAEDKILSATLPFQTANGASV